MKAFDCKQCGDCCYGEGGIYLEVDDIKKASRFLGMTREAFLFRYCEKRNGRIYIRTGEDGYCIMYDREKSCLIHPVKPKPCSLWPYFPAIVNDRENWEMAKEACPGINPHCKFIDFVKQSKA